MSQAKFDQVSPYGGRIELCQISDSHAETEDAGVSDSLPRTNTLDGIKARMIKHLSQDVSSRRQSRVSIGHSDEELARRAEVRRLRQKRIQDELEGDNAGDAPSVGSNHSTQRLATFVDLGSPRSGPRDTIEFSVDDCVVASSPVSDFSSSQCSQTCAATCLTDIQNKDTCYSTRCSLGPETQSDTNDIPSRTSPHRAPLPEQKRNSAVTTPLRPSSELGSSRMERILGVESDFNIRHGSHAWDDQSALGVWLIAQGIKLNDNPVPRVEQSIRADCSPVRHASSTFNDIAGVDSIMESSFSMPDGTINAKSSHPDDKEPENMESGGAITEENNEKPANDSKADAKAVERVKDPGSSNYPSAIPSVDSSPSVSEARSYVLSQQDMENLELSPIRCTFVFPNTGKSRLTDVAISGYRRLPTCKELGYSEGKSSYTTAEEQYSSNIAHDSDVPELLGAFISHSPRRERELRHRRPAGEQTTAPDLNKPLPAPGFRGNLGHESHVGPSSSRESCIDILQATPKRASLKQKLQKSFSGLSKLGDHNKPDRTIPEVPSSRESQKPIMGS
ncbi:hypothetical protein E4U41_000075 [Claviceps citrina]|nr:hypothetical protein E4U41_000075 [Claviceps citrina]